MTDEELRPADVLDLLDWKRRVFAAYADVRSGDDVRAAWDRWRATRDRLFRTHPQSPVPAASRASFRGVPYYDYDPAMRVAAEVIASDAGPFEIPGSAGETFRFTRFAFARFDLEGAPAELGLYWLDAYGDGVFLSFRDATSGTETYGACRYLLDTVKGADLGTEEGELVLDFNFAYNPSCSYDPRWACPLAPAENRLDVAVRAGERIQTAP